MPKTRHPREELEHIITTGKPQYVKQLFDSIAEDYDRMNRIMTGGLLSVWHRMFMRETGLQAGHFGLDVCCGTGDLTFLQSKQVGPTGRVVGLDFSPNMLEIAAARQKAATQQAGGPKAAIQWIRGDALKLPFPDGDERRGFHCVSMGFALRNVTDVSQALREMTRVATVGGRIICLEVSRPDNPLLRFGFHIYFFRIVPILGRLAEKRLPEGSSLKKLRPYTYLPYSLEHLPPPGDILHIMREAGLTQVRRRPLTGGMVSLYIGEKA